MYITKKEAAILLGVNERQIQKMIKAGKLRYKDIGVGNRKEYRVLKEDIITPDTYTEKPNNEGGE